MAETNKNQKFLEFYLNELLNHVKNTSEHRFQPAEFSAIKKTLVYLSHAHNPSERIETLKKVAVLKPLHDFFMVVLNRFQDPAYRKSQMMASMEVDSEKVSQIFAAIFQSQSLRNDLVAQLPAIGITLQFRLTQDAPAASPVFVPDIQPAEKQTVKKPEETVPKEFKRVGDMLGFLTNRTKKFAAAKEEKIVPAEPRLTEETPVSSLSEFKSAVRTDLKDIQKALSHVQVNPKRVTYIIELADAVGAMKKTMRLYEAMSLYDHFRKIEKTLNDVADRVDDKTTSVDENASAALISLFQTVHEWTQSPETVTADGLETSIIKSAETFHRHLTPVATIAEKILKTDKAREQTASGLNQIVLDMTSVDTDNFAIFKDESQYYLNTVETILSHFEDTEPMMALREIDQAIRAVNTASRMMRLQFISDLCGAYIRSIETLLKRNQSVPPEFVGYYQLAQEYFRNLIGLKPIPLTDWQRLLAVLVDTDKTIFELKEKLLVPKEPVIKAAKPELKEAIIHEAGGRQWIDAVQAVLVEFFNAAPKPVSEEEPETGKESEISIIDTTAATGKPAVEPVAEISGKAVPETPAIKETKGTKEPKEPKEKIRVASVQDFDLLAMMVNPDSDLSRIRVSTFIEKMNIEPEDIPEISKRQIRKIVREKAETETYADAQTKTPGQETKPLSQSDTAHPEQLQTKLQKIRLFEHKFADVDAELLDIFNQESESYFRLYDKAIRRLQANIRDESALKDIERVSHSIKSSARMLGFEKISGIAACVEMITERYFEKEIVFDEFLLTLFEDIVTTLRSLYKTEQVDITSIAERLAVLEKKFSVPRLFTRYIVDDDRQELTGPPATGKSEVKTVSDQTEVIPQTVTETVADGTSSKSRSYFESVGIDPEIIDIFREEAATYFKLFDSALRQLEAEPHKKEPVKDLEKSAHSLRSSSRMIGLAKIADLTRPVEIISERIYKGSLTMPKDVLQLLRRSVQTLKQLSGGEDSDIESLLKQLHQLEDSDSVNADSIPDGDSEPVSVPESGLQTLKVSDEPGQKKTVKPIKSKKGKKTIQPFSDIAFTDDPILKHKIRQEENLLDEMSVNSQN